MKRSHTSTVSMVCSAAAFIAVGCATHHYQAPVVYTAPPPGVISRPRPAVVDSGPAYPLDWRPIQSQAAPVQPPAAPALDQAAPAQTENVVIPLHGEKLRVGTREVESGAVRLRKVVKTETVNEPVTLRREEIVIDRLPADQASAQEPNQPNVVDLNQPFTEQTITIPVRREEPVVQTEVVQTGQVVARKQLQAQPTTVQKALRQEDVEIAEIGHPQGVAVAPGLRSDVMRENNPDGTGRAPAYQSATATASGHDAIVDLADVSQTMDLVPLAGQVIEVTNARVENIVGNDVLALRAPGGKLFYVRALDAARKVTRGDLVKVWGRLQTVPRDVASLGLSPAATEALRSSPVYVDLTDLRKTGR